MPCRVNAYPAAQGLLSLHLLHQPVFGPPHLQQQQPLLAYFQVRRGGGWQEEGLDNWFGLGGGGWGGW